MSLLREALEHSARSIHHPHCASRRSGATCDCHVAKAQAALASIRTVAVPPSVLALCAVKTERAEDLTREDISALTNWCDCQTEGLWAEMSLQEILNVYRATAEYDTFEGWAEEDWQAAHAAWNAAVIKPGNRMVPRDA
jgi:hypothetical protein